MFKGKFGSFAIVLALGAQSAPAAAGDFYSEFGTRYWYSSGKTNFGFYNGDAFFGDPTSTLDWTGLTAHTGELFARITHDSGFYLKGTIGGGNITGGQIINRDFIAGQIKFSDTYSEVRGDSLRYATADIGFGTWNSWGRDRIGAFVGVQYWSEKTTAYGVRCNPDDFGGVFCAPPGTVVVPFTVAVGGYEPTAWGLRVGFDYKYHFAPGFSVSGDVAFLPYVNLKNLDSHYLRVGPGDLGPTPNIISTAKYAWGFATEAFVNYAFTPNIEIGAGVRYWGVFANGGDVVFNLDGGSTAGPFPLRNLDMQRWGLLLQLKGQM